MQILVGPLFLVVWFAMTVVAGFAEKTTLHGHLGAIGRGFQEAVLLPFYVVWNILGPKVWHYLEAGPSPKGWISVLAGLLLWCAAWMLAALVKPAVVGIATAIGEIATAIGEAASALRRRPIFVLEVVFWPIFVGRWVFRRVMTGNDGAVDFILGATTGFLVWMTATGVWLALVLHLVVLPLVALLGVG